MYVRRTRRAAAGHLKIAVGICLPHPIPSVFQPVSAILFALMSKPGDFIITPDPDAPGVRLPWRSTDAVIVELDQIGQVLALPAAESDAALAPVVDAVGKADLQGGIQRLVRILLDAQRERMEIKKQAPVMHEAAARSVAIAQDHVPASMPGLIRPDQPEQM